MLSLATRPNPNPSFGTQKLEEDGRAWLRAMGVAMLRVNAVATRATGMTEGAGIGATKLGSRETRESDDRGKGRTGDTGR